MDITNPNKKVKKGILCMGRYIKRWLGLKLLRKIVMSGCPPTPSRNFQTDTKLLLLIFQNYKKYWFSAYARGRIY